MNLAAASAEEMRALGARLAAALRAATPKEALLIGLSGDLGAGKTTLVSGFLAALGHDGAVRSPTYTLIEPYRLAGRDVYHCDLYRLRDPAELDELGLRDLAVDGSVLLIEWPERAGDRLGRPDLALQLGYSDAGRSVAIEAVTGPGRLVARGAGLDQA